MCIFGCYFPAWFSFAVVFRCTVPVHGCRVHGRFQTDSLSSKVQRFLREIAVGISSDPAAEISCSSAEGWAEFGIKDLGVSGESSPLLFCFEKWLGA